jgi:glycosyltransferase involved in cell wall biosynthesis
MPTLARRERAANLRAAVASVRAQRDVHVDIILVVNGDRFDPELVGTFQGTKDIRVIWLARADLPAALLAGRQCVDTEWFAELDDDDLLLPDALIARLKASQGSSDCDAVVSNGIIVDHQQTRLHAATWSEVERDPLRALMQSNWLQPCAGLYRSAAVTADIVSGMPRYLEWTYLAMRLALASRLRFIQHQGFIYHADTAGSLSKSPEYLLEQPAAIDALLALGLPKDVRHCFERRRTVACNAVAQTHFQNGAFRDAWNWHLQTLRSPGGWRYLLFARRFLSGLMPWQRTRTT